MENEKNFITRDIYLASTLLSLKFKLVGIDFQVEGNRIQPVGYFQFENSPELREADMKYWQGALTIEPQMFVNNMRSLKSRIHNVYKSPHSNFPQNK